MENSATWHSDRHTHTRAQDSRANQLERVRICQFGRVWKCQTVGTNQIASFRMVHAGGWFFLRTNQRAPTMACWLVELSAAAVQLLQLQENVQKSATGREFSQDELYMTKRKCDRKCPEISHWKRIQPRWVVHDKKEMWSACMCKIFWWK